MAWTETETDAAGSVVEWEREDGWATIRCRQRIDGSWVVRLDRLTQAPDGSYYRQERVETRADARMVVAAWREQHDVVDEEGGGADEGSGTGDGDVDS
jgi:hypothetical protein